MIRKLLQAFGLVATPTPEPPPVDETQAMADLRHTLEELERNSRELPELTAAACATAQKFHHGERRAAHKTNPLDEPEPF